MLKGDLPFQVLGSWLTEELKLGTWCLVKHNLCSKLAYDVPGKSYWIIVISELLVSSSWKFTLYFKFYNFFFISGVDFILGDEDCIISFFWRLQY